MIPWNIYPRPLMQRDSFLNLNGPWDFCICEETETPLYQETIRVPYCPQSKLSGIGRAVPQSAVCHYRRHFSLPEGFRKDRVLLHFGAADQEAAVWLNGRKLGSHQGGYHPFSFDITAFLQPDNLLTLEVRDHLDDAVYPYGKQKEKRGGMWYTPVTGIWQTVWVESVCADYIHSLQVKQDERGLMHLDMEGTLASGTLTLSDSGESFPILQGSCTFRPVKKHLWTPEDPYLYHFTVDMESGDRVQSYFAMRTLSTETVDGVPRLCLNGKPYFFHGLLDQGYFPDGIFTPERPEDYEKDILLAKSLGFSTLRKHIKIEPQVFYAACDRLGIIVFQDMVNNGRYSFLRDTALPTVGLKRLPGILHPAAPRMKHAFMDAMLETVQLLQGHPSICLWTIFNEGWGQFDGNRMYARLREMDRTRFIDTASGWFRCRQTDVFSPHIYFRPYRFRPHEKPTLLSEFGGYVKKEEGHLFNENASYGYKYFSDSESYIQALEKLYDAEILPAIPEGLCGCIYTQLTDVEDELNGLVTYDRQVVKVPAERMQKIAGKLKL
ncbi:MAG: glycoside hydrolase family 2 [Clostridia bacterium]|nr:glycoside hydrolase family 2 [Clostridia bacterium]